MDTTDSLSIVAIVVASIAFFVAISQVLQQYFATAEGYRRCQYSVMGQWSGFTYRKFRWSELRFETRFTTPHIRFGVRLGQKLDVEPTQIPLLLTTVEMDKQNQETTGAAARDTSEFAGWVQLVEDIENLQTEMIRYFPMHASILASRGTGPGGGHPLSMPQLKFGQKQHIDRGPKLLFAHDKVNAGSPDLSCSVDNHQIEWPANLELVSCSLRNQSWDFMPPDVIKPLASEYACKSFFSSHR